MLSKHQRKPDRLEEVQVRYTQMKFAIGKLRRHEELTS